MTNPLLDRPPEEIRLGTPPLERVLCVVRFSAVIKIGDPNGLGIADFQERVRQRYPTLQQDQEHAFQFEVNEGSPATPTLMSQTVWRFFDKEQKWRVSLTRESLGIETKHAYTNRAEFLERLVELCQALQAAFGPSQCLKIGVRYLNVLSGDRLARLPEMVAPEYLAFGQQPFSNHLVFSHQNAEFDVPEGRLIARFGLLAAGQVHDPQVLDPVDERRYFLDLDAVMNEAMDFSFEEIEHKVRGLTERIYSVFRGAATKTLLESCDAR